MVWNDYTSELCLLHKLNDGGPPVVFGHAVSSRTAGDHDDHDDHDHDHDHDYDDGDHGYDHDDDDEDDGDEEESYRVYCDPI